MKFIKRAKDVVKSGIIIGIVIPVSAFLLIYLFTANGLWPDDYITKLVRKDILTHMISLSVFFNIVPFLLVNKYEKWKIAKGILGITFVWAFIVFVIKFI